jgi:transcriptional regulator with XRE-family HTH domain
VEAVTDAEIGANVKALRESMQLTQAEVGTQMRKAGFQSWRQTTVNKTESGERPLKFSEALELAVIVHAYRPFLSYPVIGLLRNVPTAVKENRIRLAEQRLAEAKQS